MPEDQWGHPHIYPSKSGGFTYEQSNNILDDDHFNGEGDVTEESTVSGLLKQTVQHQFRFLKIVILLSQSVDVIWILAILLPEAMVTSQMIQEI
jgi:hypothetical protein